MHGDRNPFNNRDEYAEEYNRRERLRIVVIAMSILLPTILLTGLWGLPALREFADKSHCYQLLGIGGTTLLMYGVFVGLPVFVMLVLGLPLAWRGMKVIRDRRSPPLSTKVFRRTRIRRGNKAILIGWGYQLPFLYLLIMAAWGVSRAEDFLGFYDDSHPDYSVCALSDWESEASVSPRVTSLHQGPNQ